VINKIGLLAGCASNEITYTDTEVKAQIAEAKASVICDPEIVTEYVETETIVEVDKIVEVEKIVEVDNGNMDSVLEYAYENEGNMSLVIDDLDDDELDLIVDRIAFINEIKQLAIDEVKAEGIDELDKEITEVNNITIDEDDIDRFRIYDDADEIEVDAIDFEDGDADVSVDVRFEQDDVRYYAKFLVEFKDGKVDDISLEGDVTETNPRD